MLKDLNKIFKILPESGNELSSNLICRRLIKLFLSEKFFIITLFILFSLSVIVIQSSEIGVKLINKISFPGGTIFYLILYILSDGLLNPCHWIELILIIWYLKIIKKIFIMIQETLITPREFLMGAIYPILGLLFLLDVNHIASYAVVGFYISSGSGRDYLANLYYNPLFYISSPLLTFTLVLLSFQILILIRSILYAVIISGVLIYFILPVSIHFIFSVFFFDSLLRLYNVKNYFIVITAEYLPYVIISLIIIWKLGNILNENLYKGLSSDI